MDGTGFDWLVRELFGLGAGTRRGMLRLLATLALVGGSAALRGAEDARANGAGIGGGGHRKRKRRRQGQHRSGHNNKAQRRRQRARQRKKQCTPTSRAITCAGKCGQIKNNCKKSVDCGSCGCDPPCDACRVCNEVTRVCETDPNQQGDACGEPGQVCQASGDCACDATSCASGQSCDGGDCGVACGGDFCPAAMETCDEGSCQPCDVCASGCPFASVQDAIDDADANDTISICAGVFVGNVFIDKNVTILGAGDDATTLQGTGDGRVVGISGTPTVEIRNLTITGGNSPSVGGGIANSNATTTLVNVTVTGNHAAQRGGGIDINFGGSMTLTACRVIGNEADEFGGGIYNVGQLELHQTSVTENTSGASGGGLGNGSGVVQATDCTFAGNTAELHGGAIRNEDGGSVTLTGCTLTENTASHDGGAFYTIRGTVIAENCTFADNEATSDSGGALLNRDAEVTLTGCTVSGNRAGDTGGGLRVDTVVDPGGTLRLVGTGVTDNEAGNDGGGIFNFGGVVILEQGSDVSGNEAPPGTPNDCVNAGGGTGCP
jgi:parallel beta-helix repeat protein/predicted outer membrane repeat protein